MTIYRYQEEKRTTYLGINALATRYYRKALSTSKVGLTYCRERGIDTGSIKAFRIGYAGSEWTGLTEELTRLGVNIEDAVALGLVSRNARGYADRMRGRLVFPVVDAQGRTIAFSGRLIGQEKAGAPKYWNSPETPVYIKGNTLYGLPQSLERVSTGRSILLVEGNVDVVTAHQYGFRFAVAPLGTALTAPQAASLASVATRVYLALDADKAGRKAAMRAAPLLWEAGVREVRLAALPEGLDPDTAIRAGRDVFTGALEESVVMTWDMVKEFGERLLKDEEDLRGRSGAPGDNSAFVGSVSEPWRGQG